MRSRKYASCVGAENYRALALAPPDQFQFRKDAVVVSMAARRQPENEVGFD